MARAKILKLIHFSCNSLLLTSYLQSRIIHLANSPTDELSEKKFNYQRTLFKYSGLVVVLFKYDKKKLLSNLKFIRKLSIELTN